MVEHCAPETHKWCEQRCPSWATARRHKETLELVVLKLLARPIPKSHVALTCNEIKVRGSCLIKFGWGSPQMQLLTRWPPVCPQMLPYNRTHS